MGILDPGIQYANTTSDTTASSTGGTQQQSTNTSTTGVGPQFVQQHQQDVLNLGRQGAVEGGVAGLTGDEQAAADLARQQTGNWVPGLSASMQLATTAGTTPATQNIQQYMNPYQTQVVDAAQRAGLASLDRGRQQALGSGITGGGFGGSRSQRAAAQGYAEGSANLADKIGQLQHQGWQSALGASQNDLNRALQAAGQLSGDAARAQALGAADVNQLSQLGATERGINQQGLDYKLKTAQQLAGLGQQVAQPFGTTNTQTGQNISNEQRNQTSSVRGTSPFKSTDSTLDKLLGGGTALAQLLGGFGGGGGGGGNPLGSLISAGGSALNNLFGGGGGSWMPSESDWSTWADQTNWDPGFAWAEGGGVTPMGRMASGGMPPKPLDPEMKKSMKLANPQMQSLAEGGQPTQGMDNMDPMQALDALAQAGVPPELLQQVQQALQGGGGMGGGGGGMPPGGGMARGGLACMSHGGMPHMAGGGGAYGISPEVIQRLLAASGGRNPMGGQSANPFAPGHMGSGQAGMSDMGSSPQEAQARRRAMQMGMVQTQR